MTMAEMTESTIQAPADAAPAASAPRHLGLRAVLIVAALFEAAQALPDVPTLFGDMSKFRDRASAAS